MGKLARIVVFTILLAGVGLGASSSAAPGPAPTAVTLEVGTSATCAYHTIAAAIAAANPGDTIKVENTVFVESPLVVSKDLTLAGGYHSADPYSCLTLTGYNHTTVRRSGVTPAPILRINSAEVTITWFIFENNANGSGLEVNNATLNLEDSIVRDNDNSGLLIDGGSDVTLVRAEVSGNSANAGGGLNIDGFSDVVADNTVIRDNSGWDHGAGVSLRVGSTFTASNNTSIRHNRTVLGIIWRIQRDLGRIRQRVAAHAILEGSIDGIGLESRHVPGCKHGTGRQQTATDSRPYCTGCQ